MINFETFVFGLMVSSVLTGLVTEAMKKILTENKIKYQANTLAGLVAMVLSGAIGSGYVVMTDSAFTSKVVICIIAQVFLSWLCAMVGYDKVVQAVTQFKTSKRG